MSEVLPRSKHEKGEQSPAEKEKAAERNRERAAERERAAAEAEKKNQEVSIEAIQERIEKAAQTKEALQTSQAENAASESASALGGRQLGSHMTKRTLSKVQKQLSPADRAASKFIHQPVVEAVSNVAGESIARPTGLLTGGLFSIVSSLAILYICRHYGYEYNFLIGLVFFVGGFVLGVVLEGIYKLFKRK